MVTDMIATAYAMITDFNSKDVFTSGMEHIRVSSLCLRTLSSRRTVFNLNVFHASAVDKRRSCLSRALLLWQAPFIHQTQQVLSWSRPILEWSLLGALTSGVELLLWSEISAHSWRLCWNLILHFSAHDSLHLLDNDVKQESCMWLPFGPCFQSTEVYTFPSVSSPIHFKVLSCIYFHLSAVILCKLLSAEQGWPHSKMHSYSFSFFLRLGWALSPSPIAPVLILHAIMSGRLVAPCRRKDVVHSYW